VTSTPPTARILGTLRRTEDGKGAVRMEDLYDTDIEDLWSALTDPRRLTRWIADVEGDLRLGGQIHARFTSAWDGPGRIDTCWHRTTWWSPWPPAHRTRQSSTPPSPPNRTRPGC